MRILIIGLLLCFSCHQKQPLNDQVNPSTNMVVPLAGNSFLTSKRKMENARIAEKGLSDWSDSNSIISTFCYFGDTGIVHLAIKAMAREGTSTIRVTVQGISFTTILEGANASVYFLGSTRITKPGYLKVDLQGINRTGAYFGEVSDLLFGGPATANNVVFANDSLNYYWSRRGPSCHLNFVTPAEDIEYFYSELEVPVGADKVGAYFMANGFREGYFGMQVNSATERRVLFSIWDPANGQAALLKKGADVFAGRFDGEGEGSQSYMRFNWQAGNTYKFLTRVSPDAHNNTLYSAWFFAPERNAWLLIAIWLRPNTNTYQKGLYSFIENFESELGYLGRKGNYRNQWVRTAKGAWIEISNATFSVDNTGRKKQRLDYDGGVENGNFYLQNGAFIKNSIENGTVISRPTTGHMPSINLNTLP